jgi:hypothetical protein
MADSDNCGAMADKLRMGQARERRRREEKKRGGGGRGDWKLDVRRRVKGLLSRFSLLGAFEAMPSDLRDQFFGFCSPDPVLVFDASFPSAEVFGGAYADIRAEVRAGFEAAEIELKGFKLPVRDFYAIAIPLEAMVRNSLAKIDSVLSAGPRAPATVRGFLEKSAGVLNYLVRQEVIDASFHALHKAVVVRLVARSRLDGNLLHARLTNPQAARGRRLTMTLYAEKPAMKYVRLHNGTSGGSRPMHRVGTPNVWNGIEWTSWSREVLKGHWQEELGIEGEAQWPVFVQSHALKQLRERLNAYAYADWAEHWMHESLKQPKIVSRLSHEQLLVAYEVLGKRLGYLVVTVGKGWVGVRTFLFLTMAQTPEGKMLERRLKMEREEVEHWGLHKLDRYLHTDLKDDAQLRALFSECGCGQLFELAEDAQALEPTAQKIIPFAAELKQYAQVAA